MKNATNSIGRSSANVKPERGQCSHVMMKHLSKEMAKSSATVVNSVCVPPVIANDLGHTVWDRIDEGLEQLQWDLRPCILDPLPQLLAIARKGAGEWPLHVGPDVLDWVEIRRIARPIENGHSSCLEKCAGGGGSVDGGIILLENPTSIPSGKIRAHIFESGQNLILVFLGIQNERCLLRGARPRVPIAPQTWTCGPDFGVPTRQEGWNFSRAVQVTNSTLLLLATRKIFSSEKIIRAHCGRGQSTLPAPVQALHALRGSENGFFCSDSPRQAENWGCAWLS